jgi:hypothetical protein
MEEVGGKDISFGELNFRQYVAGELEIILEGDIPQSEKVGRLRLMKKLAYLLGGYEWRQVREVYGYVNTRIQRGMLDWRDNMGEEIQWALQRKLSGKSEQRRRAGPSDKVFYCQAYQRGTCTKTSPHEDVIGGRKVTVHHLCARCLQRDKTRAEHSEMNCTA